MNKTETLGTTIYCDGNKAAAYGVLLARPDLIAVYPITPQTQVAEMLATFRAQGRLDAEIVEVEGETSAIGVVYGAAAAGGRVFTATSGAGLQFMHDGFVVAGSSRLPMVMVNVSREIYPPWIVASGEQDIMGELDSGWIQIHVESCQEILDTVLSAYRLAEDPEVRCAVVLNYDGYYLSHLSEPVKIPLQEEVDRFLPRPSPDFPVLRAGGIACGVSFTPPEDVHEYRRRHLAAMERAKRRADTIDSEFEALFGRTYGGQIEAYRMEDAEIAIMAIGSCAGTARVAIDMAREKGIAAGLVKIRMLRPFPAERIVQALSRIKAVGVVDRNVCFGWNCGHLFMELRAALYGSARIPLLNFLGGLGGADITLEDIEGSIETVAAAVSAPEAITQINWFHG